MTAPNIGLNEEARRGVAAILNRTLADEYVLYTKTRNYHWNVVGPRFNDLHKFFEAQYEVIDDAIDEIAERARALGEPAAGTLAEFLRLARLSEATPAANDNQMIANLLADHESLIRSLRQDLETCASKFQDAGNQDVLTGLMEEHEKMAWMLRAHLA